MDERERDSVVFETEDGSEMEFNVIHEFCYDGGMYAVLQRDGSTGDTLIAEVVDPMGPDEEFLPLSMDRQQTLLDFLSRGGAGDD